jgi:exopolysaccharide biosynthesis polyprenyl glycosylphosphotransferase
MAASESVAPNLYAETIAIPRSERRLVSRGRFKSVMAATEAAADFLACTAGTSAACFFSVSTHAFMLAQSSVREITAISVAAGLLLVLLLHDDGAYRRGGGLLRIRETERAIRFSSQVLLLLLMVSLLLGLDVSSAAFLLALITVPLLLVFQKQIFFAVVRILHLRECGIDRVVVYGAGEAGRSIVSTLLNSPRLGFRPVAVIEDDPARADRRISAMGYRRGCPAPDWAPDSIPVRCGPVTPALLKSLRCGVLMVAPENLCAQDLAEATRAARQAGAGVTLLYGPATQGRQWKESLDIDGLLLASAAEPVMPWRYAAAKRAVDVTLSSLLLMLSAPLLFVIALLVWLDSPGPALFVQKRVGRNGELFNIYKFRSMYTGTPKYGFSPTTSNDPRITRIGQFLRRASLDELPQLMNVFLGSMSLVGPRPEMPFVVRRYDARQRRRLQAAPGITGLWQLSADRGFPIHQNIDYDLYYIRNRSFFMDLSILVHTLFFAMRGGI